MRGTGRYYNRAPTNPTLAARPAVARGAPPETRSRVSPISPRSSRPAPCTSPGRLNTARTAPRSPSGALRPLHSGTPLSGRVRPGPPGPGTGAVPHGRAVPGALAGPGPDSSQNLTRFGSRARSARVSAIFPPRPRFTPPMRTESRSPRTPCAPPFPMRRRRRAPASRTRTAPFWPTLLGLLPLAVRSSCGAAHPVQVVHVACGIRRAAVEIHAWGIELPPTRRVYV